MRDSDLKCLQVCLPVYMAGFLKRMKVASLMHKALLRELGPAARSPWSLPVKARRDVQGLGHSASDIDTVWFCKVIRGNDARFISFVREVTEDAQNYIQVEDAIADAVHALHGWNHVRVVPMPTQHGVCTFKKSAAEQPGADALKWSGANAQLYYDLFLRATYAVDSKCSTCFKGDRHDELVAGITLEGLLTLFECWHVLEFLLSKWTTEHRYKGNCSVFFKRGSCSHVLMLGMLNNKAITIPAPSHYSEARVQGRRKRGHPGRAAEMKDAEAGNRERVLLSRSTA
jgi:hypothetical protein